MFPDLVLRQGQVFLTLVWFPTGLKRISWSQILPVNTWSQISTCKHQHEEDIEYLDLFQILCHQDLSLSVVNAAISFIFLSGLYETQQSLHYILDTNSQQTAKLPREHIKSAGKELHSLQQGVSHCYDSNGTWWPYSIAARTPTHTFCPWVQEPHLWSCLGIMSWPKLWHKGA